MQRDSVLGTFTVALVLCVACSLLVSGAAVGLKSIQTENRLLDKKKNVLLAAGLYDPSTPVEKAFGAVEARVVNLETGEYVDGDKIENTLDVTTYDQVKAAKDPKWSVAIPGGEDLGGIKRRERYSFVYLVKKDGALDQIVVPINGKGLWSTLYGFLALHKDLQTIRGITFYEHKETPGLGGEVDNPKWKAQWVGKRLFDEPAGKPVIQVLKGSVDPTSPNIDHQVDGLAGATITARGVENLVRYWLGDGGFGNYLEKRLQKRKASDGQ